ncbi:MAG: ATP-dependent zinc metalloprotease FtsH [Clostridia bacterium]|nr:ATP-dependent zinc metalloprotease FtsH [Clostridia bacterium]
MNGGAKKIDRTDFQTYVENTQYYNSEGKPNEIKIKVDEEKKPVRPFVYVKDNEEGQKFIVSVSEKDDKGDPIILEGYKVKDGVIVTDDEKGTLTVIWKVSTKDYEYTGYTKNSKGDYVKSYYCYGPSAYNVESWDSETLNLWQSWGVKIDQANPNAGSWVSTVLYFVVIAVVCVVFFLIIRSSMGGAGKVMSFAKTKARISTNIKVRFTDVAGAEEEKVELAEIVEFLRQPKKFSDLGARIPKGVLLVGPPGTGKTLFAKAVAGEAGVPFFSVSGSDFVEMYVGVGASRVRDLFDMAKKNQPCIIFVDEIDAVGRHRGAGLGGGNDEREQTLNQILVQMDGFESNEGVIVMAATNRADILDPALLRPGRFDRQIYVNLPDVKGREQILKVHARNKPVATDVNFKTVARMTAGFSGADLANVLNEAAILAARAGKNFITNADLYEAINKVEMGPQKKSHVVTESDKRITAYHESGHAIIAKLCKDFYPVHEVTIIPRGNALGYTSIRPDNDDVHMAKSFLLDRICMGLGGRVAEELAIKEVCTGASGDIKQVTDIAKSMVTEWGMSDKLGLIAYGSDSQTVFLGKDMETHNVYSEETAKVIDEEMRNIIDTEYKRARKLLTENRSVLDNMARVLIEKETIYTEEVDMLIAGKSVEEVIKYMDEEDQKHSENAFKRYEG